MGKTYLSTVKYVITTNFTIDGIVDKHDIIGAIFGQSEGLVGEEMDLKELQKNGKVGRIDVETKVHGGKTTGVLTVPSSMDKVKTTLLAATVETVDKVGPCSSTFLTEKIEDTREEKRKTVTERAKELLKEMSIATPETDELTEEIRQDMRSDDFIEFGPEKLPAGPEVETNEEIIIVEGRADVMNLLRHGVKNVIAINGAKTPQSVIDLSQRKTATAFVDGDRGGDLIARQLTRLAKIAFIARAPDGKEVEELTLKEILAALRKKQEAATATMDGIEGFEPRNREERSGPYRESRGPGRSGPFRERGPGRGPPFREHRGPGRGRGSPFGESPGPRDREERSGPYRESRGPGRGAPFRESRGPGTRDRSGPGRGRFGDRRREGGGFGGRGFRRRESFESAQGPEQEGFAPERQNDLGEYGKHMQELNNSLKARFLDDSMNVLKEVSVRDLLREMESFKGCNAVVFDGIVTKRLVEQAEKNEIKGVVGIKKGKLEENPKVKVQTLY
jgi:DNA primase